MLDRLRQLEAIAPGGEFGDEDTRILVRGLVHKMNNMLTIFRGYSSLLLMEDGITGSAKATVTEMSEGANTAAEILNRTIAITEPVNVNSVSIEISQLHADLPLKLKKSLGKSTRLTISGNNDCRIFTDLRLLLRMLGEIVSNAVLAMPDDGEVIIETMPPEDDSTAYTLSVFDSGTGIPAECINKVWQPFFSYDKLRQRAGLGLALVRHLASSCGIQPAIASEFGIGTRFDLKIPSAKP